MTDGAHGGITPERALKTIIGGKPAPEADDGMSVQEMRAWIEAAPETPTGYNDGCRLIAKLVLEHYTVHPEDGTLSAWELDDAIKEKSPDLWTPIEDIGMTGFMWGWAINAARRCFELPPVPNPAILTIGGDA